VTPRGTRRGGENLGRGLCGSGPAAGPVPDAGGAPGGSWFDCCALLPWHAVAPISPSEAWVKKCLRNFDMSPLHCSRVSKEECIKDTGRYRLSHRQRCAGAGLCCYESSRITRAPWGGFCVRSTAGTASSRLSNRTGAKALSCFTLPTAVGTVVCETPKSAPCQVSSTETRAPYPA
jgi:hypothetical protein